MPQILTNSDFELKIRVSAIRIYPSQVLQLFYFHKVMLFLVLSKWPFWPQFVNKVMSWD